MADAAQFQKISIVSWDKKLRWCEFTCKLKVLTIFVVGIINIGAMGYGGYRLYPHIPKWAFEGVVYMPLIAGVIGGIVVHNKGKSLPARELNEKNAGVYKKPIMVASMIASIFLLLPTVGLINSFDRTPYNRSEEREATTKELREWEFEKIAVQHGGRWKNLIRYGYLVPNKGDIKWLKKNISEAQKLVKTLDDYKARKSRVTPNGSQRPDTPKTEQQKCNAARDKLNEINQEWNNRKGNICFVLEGEIEASPPASFFERHFLWVGDSDREE